MIVTKYNLSLPVLKGITPTLESSVLKLVEEVGEVAERTGKYRGINGERFSLPDASVNKKELTKELVDVIQSVVTILSVLEVPAEEIDKYVKTVHVRKMKKRGYL